MLAASPEARIKTATTHLVPRHGPAALGDELGGLLVNARLGGGDLVDGEVLEGAGRLDVGERLLQVLELQVDLVLGGLGVLDGLDLEDLDGLQLAGEVVGGGLEGVEALLDLVDDGLVLEHGAVLGEVDGGRLLGEELHLAADVVVALLEGLEADHRLAAQAEGRGDLGPVDLESCASLYFSERETSKLAQFPQFRTSRVPAAAILPPDCPDTAQTNSRPKKSSN